MGECLISRRGGEAYKLPVLDASYPKDVTVVASSNGIAAFSVQISENGKPAEYTYKWYVNGVEIAATTASYTRNTTASGVGTYTIYCEVTNKAGTVQSRVATLVVKNPIPVQRNDYNGEGTLTKENDYDWNFTFKTSGSLNLSRPVTVDIFLCGGGGGGASACNNGGGGGGGGYTLKESGVSLAAGKYDIVIGSGGAGAPAKWANNGGDGGTTTFGNTYSANGGKGGISEGGSGGAGTGNGGGGSGHTGYAGGDGAIGALAFGGGTIFYGGGGGGGGGCFAGGGAGGQTGGGKGGSCGGDGQTIDANNAPKNGMANTGGGGGGGATSGGDTFIQSFGANGGSGIVIIRNTR